MPTQAEGRRCATPDHQLNDECEHAGRKLNTPPDAAPHPRALRLLLGLCNRWVALPLQVLTLGKGGGHWLLLCCTGVLVGYGGAAGNARGRVGATAERRRLAGLRPTPPQPPPGGNASMSSPRRAVTVLCSGCEVPNAVLALESAVAVRRLALRSLTLLPAGERCCNEHPPQLCC